MQRQVTWKERKQESRDVLGSFFYNKLFLGNLISSHETVYSKTLALIPSQGSHLLSAAPFDVMTLKTKLPTQRSSGDKPHASMASGVSSPWPAMQALTELSTCVLLLLFAN